MKKQFMKGLAASLIMALSVTTVTPVMAAEEAAPKAESLNSVYNQYYNMLQKYRDAQRNGFYDGDSSKLESMDLNMLVSWGSNVKLYYSLVDLAGDGVPELFIADVYKKHMQNDPFAQYNIYDSLGAKNMTQCGRIFPLWNNSLGYRSRYVIMNNGIIYNYGSSGAGSSLKRFYKLDPNSYTQSLFKFYELDGNSSYVNYYKGTNNPNVRKPSSEYEFRSAEKQFSVKQGIDWRPIADLSYLYNDLYKYTADVRMDGKLINFDQPPIIKNNRTLVPVRKIFNELGADVQWDATTRTVTSTRGNTKITMKIGSGIMYKNGQAIYLDVPAQIVNNRTLVPVRAVAEAFNAKVEWDGAMRTVEITR